MRKKNWCASLRQKLTVSYYIVSEKVLNFKMIKLNLLILEHVTQKYNWLKLNYYNIMTKLLQH